VKKVMLFLSILCFFSACSKKEAEGKKVLWVYTSMYKDTITDLTPRLEKAFPDVEFKWYQAGSEDIAAKVNAEILSGNIQVDVLISSDRFWYEDMAAQGKLHAFTPVGTDKIDANLKHPASFYTAVSIPVMVLVYNNAFVKAEEAPKTFKEMTEAKWKGKFTTGSPLSSGTNFTTVAHLLKKYGWEYLEALKKNDVISEGGNSSALRRLQSGERPVAAILLENVLRFQGEDPRLQVIYPEDGVVTHANVLAITKKEGDRSHAEKFANWMFEKEGQEAVIRSYMYSPFSHYEAPKGAPSYEKIMSNAFPWSADFIQAVTTERESIKEKYTKIMFN
jgi:iron(III) transport system substrate-binding protein